ncbi:MAG: aminoglycoside phosphotransferase family protein [Jiangellaceae bacterium]
MEISAELVQRLIADQFPEWSWLPIAPVPQQGNDNRTFRLGQELSVRMPSHRAYVAGIEKENVVLPLLTSHVRVGLPSPVATGEPSDEYPFPWSVRRWLTGSHPENDPDLDRTRLAEDLGRFLVDLREIPADRGPMAGEHSFFRGCHPSVYGDQVQAGLRTLGPDTDEAMCLAIWSDAVRTVWRPAPVWLHGDLAPDNLLTLDGRLSAVIDFGTCAVGDPVCDLVIAWTFFDPRERAIFRNAVGLPEDAWARARGWALWKALITLADPNSPGAQLAIQKRALSALLDEAASVTSIATGRPRPRSQAQ